MMKSGEGIISMSEIMSSSNIRDGVALTLISVLALCQLAGRSFVGKAVEHPTCRSVLFSLLLHSYKHFIHI